MKVVRLASETDFAGWRDAARRLVLNDVPPDEVTWHIGDGGDLFSDDGALPDPAELVDRRKPAEEEVTFDL